MLMLTISNRKKPVSYTYIPPTNNHAAASAHTPVNLSIYNEAKRRSAIVEKYARECPYKEGDIVSTIKPSVGDVQVMRICREYIHMGKDEEWPTSDNPYLVTAQYVNAPHKIFNCTINYLQKKV